MKFRSRSYTLLSVPLLFIPLLLSLPSQAQNLVGDWEWGYAEDATYLWAATNSDEGMMLGEFCFFDTETCIYFIAQDVECVEGDNYPVLINGNYVQAAEIYCSHTYENLWVYIFSDYDLLDPLVRETGQIGVAMALDDGTFQLTRFSLKGSMQAMDAMGSVFIGITDSGGSSRPASLKSL